MKKIISMILVISMLLLCFVSCNSGNNPADTSSTENRSQSVREETYTQAMIWIAERKYEEAYEALKELGDYKDAQEQVSYFRYVPIEFSETEEYLGESYSSKRQYVYGENGLLEITDFSYGYKDQILSTTQSFAYDDFGNLIQIIHSNDDGISIDEYTYDNKGDRIKHVYTYSNGNKRIYEWTYDIKGNLIKEVRTEPESSNILSLITMTTEYSYDENNRLIKKVSNASYVMAGEFQYVYDYTYDMKGNLIKEICINSNYGSKSIYDYTYDVKGNLIKEVYTNDINYKEIRDYAYDSNGNLIKEVYTDSEGNKNIYDYTYDANGNLIKEIDMFDNGDKDIYEFIYDTNNNLSKVLLTYYFEDGEGYSATCEATYQFVYMPFEIPKDLEKKFDLFEYS